MYYFYILRCNDNSLYCGQTKNIKKRVEEHNTHPTKTAKYTRGRRPVRLVYFEKYETQSEALKREYEVKQWDKMKKEALVKKFEKDISPRHSGLDLPAGRQDPESI